MKIQLPYKINFSTDDYYAEHNILKSDLKLYREASDDLGSGKRKLRAIKTLQSLTEKYPDCAMFLNQLIGAYAEIDDEQNVEVYANKLWEKFPDFLVGKINKAHDLLFKNIDPDTVLESVFGGITTLEKLYPNRTMFYAIEVFNFHYLMAEIYLQKQDTKLARSNAELADQINPSNESVGLLIQQINFTEQALARESTSQEHHNEGCDCDCNDDADEDTYITPHEEKKKQQ